MVKIEPKTIKMITTTEEELIEKMISEKHAFRKLNNVIDFEKLISPYRELYSSIGAEGVDVIKGLLPNTVFGIKFQIFVNFVKNFFANITIFPQNFLKKFPKNLKFSTRKSIRRQTLDKIMAGMLYLRYNKKC